MVHYDYKEANLSTRFSNLVQEEMRLSLKISLQVILKTSIAGLAVSYEVCDAKALTELHEYLRLDLHFKCNIIENI